MTRPLRLEFAGALYHVTSRGDRQEDIYDDDADRRLFLATTFGVHYSTLSRAVSNARCKT